MTDTLPADDQDTTDPESIVLSVIPDLTLDEGRRTITGLVVPLDVVADRTSNGAVLFQAGSIRHHPDLRRIKLLVDHDQQRAVGYATALEVTDSGVVATFKVPDGAEGDEALAKADNGVRDGLSVGADVLMKHQAADGSHTVITQALIKEVSLVSLPAFSDSRVSTVTATEHRTTTTAPEDTMTDNNTAAPATPATPDSPETVALSAPSADTAGAGSPPAVPAPASPATPAPVQAPAPYTPATGQHQAGLTAATRAIAGVAQNGGGAAEIRAVVNQLDVSAALSDVIPANDAGTGFLGRPGFLGELWEARRITRPVMESFGPIGALTKLKETGWRWTTRPQVAAYTGNKTAVPSNTVATEPVEVTAERTAGGWDVDRIFVDLGDADMIEALFQAAIEDYLVKSEAWATAKVQAAATAVAAQADLASALVALGTEAGKIGASMGMVTFATDVWSDFLAMSAAELPWWINPSSRVQLDEGTVQVGNVRLSSNPSLAAGTILSGDRRAVKFKEARVRVNAVDIANGGVDLGVFAYHSALIQDARAIFSTSIAVV